MSQVPTNKDLYSKMKSFFKNDKKLHTQILLYQPIWLEDVYEEFKETSKLKVKLAQVRNNNF